MASYAFAIPNSNIRPLEQAQNALVQIATEVPSLDENQREVLRNKLSSLRQKINATKSKVNSLRPPQGANGWYQAYGDSCQNLCALAGKVSAASSDGAVCTSGEARPQSAASNISYVSGCWPNCSPEPSITTFEYGIFCYKPGQKKDGDYTDLTVGCFCK
jgi:hypothetical protein